MIPADDEFLLQLLQACAHLAPAPLYPPRFAREQNLDRGRLDEGLDELRRRGFVKLTDWVQGFGQGCALTEAGEHALRTRRLTPAAVSHTEQPTVDSYGALARGEIVREAVFAPGPAYVTWALVGANLFYFLFGAAIAQLNGLSAMDYLGSEATAVNFVVPRIGGLHASLVFNDPFGLTYSRIILFFFLHFGILHLGMNMYFLGALGPQIEAMWGSIRFLTIYLCAGIVSGCVVLLANLIQHDRSLTVGASGCLYGIFTALIVWFSLNRSYLPENVISAWSRNLGMNLMLLVAINFLPGMNISWQGHLGGAVGGLLAALLLHVQRFHRVRAVRVAALVAVPLVPLGFFIAVLWQAGRL